MQGLVLRLAGWRAGEGPELLVTVDNGIASLAGVLHARAQGLQVLVTDHHLPALVDGRVQLPEAQAAAAPDGAAPQPPAARAARRTAEAGGADVAATEVDLLRRDAADSGRATAPLVVPEGAIHLDTTDFTLDQVIAHVVALVHEATSA